jgi:UDPglucose 6-dehydrogenase
MKILVAGYGFVGAAHALSLVGKHDVRIHDPDKGYKSNYDEAEAVICCVATPQHKDGACDISSVADVIERSPNVPILIKSTISLEGWRTLLDIYPNKQITFSPEYLRAEKAMQDFKDQSNVQIGGGDESFWRKILDVNVYVKDPESLILAKYFVNSFLATKVSFFNQIYDFCEITGVDFKDVSGLVASDPRIGFSHTAVTEERGFGGHCFPKDTNAILTTARRFGTRLSLIREAVLYNTILRKPK